MRGLGPLVWVVCFSVTYAEKGEESSSWPWRNGPLSPPPRVSCFRGCAPLRFGCHCEHSCACAYGLDCSEGPSADGSCSRYHSDGTLLPPPASLSLSLSRSLLLSRLPVSPDLSRGTRQVDDGSILCRVRPQPLVPAGGAEVLLFDSALAERFNLRSSPNVLDRSAGDLAPFLSGTVSFAGSEPYAHGYAGHQFNQFNPQLGDGRSIVVGELLEGARGGEGAEASASVSVSAEGETTADPFPPPSASPRLRHELSLKGSGTTPFSRGGDGRAPLSSCVRSFLGSAFLRAVGIPAEAALAVSWNPATSLRVYRDEFYDGNVL